MLSRTHIAFAVMFILLFFNSVHSKFIFVVVVLFSSLLPDLDSMHSKLGNRWFLRPLQWFVKHRGMLHSLTFSVIIALLLDFFLPVLAFPFFLGYASHILLDSFTIEGIRPFWPLKAEVKGWLKTDGTSEKLTFVVLVIVNVLLLAYIFKVYS
ncbi:MAG: metal-dependent hydrolase [archaeon]